MSTLDVCVCITSPIDRSEVPSSSEDLATILAKLGIVDVKKRVTLGLWLILSRVILVYFFYHACAYVVDSSLWEAFNEMLLSNRNGLFVAAFLFILFLRWIFTIGREDEILPICTSVVNYLRRDLIAALLVYLPVWMGYLQHGLSVFKPSEREEAGWFLYLWFLSVIYIIIEFRRSLEACNRIKRTD